MTLIGATTENPYFEVNSALLSRSQVYELEPLCRGGAARGRAARRGELGVELDRARGARSRGAPAATRAPRSTSSSSPPQTARAEGAAITEAHVEDAARKRPLVYDKGGDAHYDFISAFIKSMRGSDSRRCRLLPRGDARGRRGRALHRAADDRARLRGHRQRRPARAARRRRGGAGGRARRPARGAAQPRAGGDLPRARAEVERVVHGARRRDRRTCASTGTCSRPTALRDGRTTRARASSAAARATSTRTTTRPASSVDYLPDELKGRTYYEPSGDGEETEVALHAHEWGDQAPALASASTASRGTASASAGSPRSDSPSAPRHRSRPARPRALERDDRRWTSRRRAARGPRDAFERVREAGSVTGTARRPPRLELAARREALAQRCSSTRRSSRRTTRSARDATASARSVRVAPGVTPSASGHREDAAARRASDAALTTRAPADASSSSSRRAESTARPPAAGQTAVP